MSDPASLPPLYPLLYEPLVRRTLEEDLGRAGDLTSDAIIPAGHRGEASIVARAAGRVAGLDVAAALAEDLGRAGDLTSQAVIPAEATARGSIVARASEVVAGLPLLVPIFARLDPGVAVALAAADGDRISSGTVLAATASPSRASGLMSMVGESF